MKAYYKGDIFRVKPDVLHFGGVLATFQSQSDRTGQLNLRLLETRKCWAAGDMVSLAPYQVNKVPCDEWLWEQCAGAARQWFALQVTSLKPSGVSLDMPERIPPSLTTDACMHWLHDRAGRWPCLPE